METWEALKAQLVSSFADRITKDALLETGQVAKFLGVSQETIRRHASRGVLQATRRAGGKRTYSLAAVAQYISKVSRMKVNSRYEVHHNTVNRCKEYVQRMEQMKREAQA